MSRIAWTKTLEIIRSTAPVFVVAKCFYALVRIHSRAIRIVCVTSEKATGNRERKIKFRALGEMFGISIRDFASRGIHAIGYHASFTAESKDIVEGKYVCRSNGVWNSRLVGEIHSFVRFRKEIGCLYSFDRQNALNTDSASASLIVYFSICSTVAWGTLIHCATDALLFVETKFESSKYRASLLRFFCCMIFRRSMYFDKKVFFQFLLDFIRR